MNRRKILFLNSIVVLLTTAINVVFGLIEVRLFIYKYGTDINGLLQTGNQLMSYVALLEAGISASYVYSLYKPIADNDFQHISNLFVGFKNNIRRTIVVMLLGATIISAVYPLVIRNTNISYITMFSVFSLVSIKAIVPYFFTYVPKYMIIAAEKKYISDIIICSTKSITYIIEILLMTYSPIPIQLILLMSAVIIALSGIPFRYFMNKVYKGMINKEADPDNSPQSMVKDVLPHNLSSLVFNSTDNIVLSILTSLNTVTVYSSYNLIVSQVNSIFQSIFDGVTASFGIKIAKKDSNSYSAYTELLIGTNFIATIVSTVFVVMINDFVMLWIGEEYVVKFYNCTMFGLIMYCSCVLPCISAARNACGLYKESKKYVIAQAITNLLITIILTPLIGLSGALIGTLFARIVVGLPFNFHLVQIAAFKNEDSRWYVFPVSILVIIIISTSLSRFIPLIICNSNSLFVLFIIHTLVTSIFTIIIVCTAFIFFSDFRRLVKQILKRKG